MLIQNTSQTFSSTSIILILLHQVLFDHCYFDDGHFLTVEGNFTTAMIRTQLLLSHREKHAKCQVWFHLIHYGGSPRPLPFPFLGRASEPGPLALGSKNSWMKAFGSGAFGSGAFGSAFGSGAFGSAFGSGAFGSAFGSGAFGSAFGSGAFGSAFGPGAFGSGSVSRASGAISGGFAFASGINPNAGGKAAAAGNFGAGGGSYLSIQEATIIILDLDSLLLFLIGYHIFWIKLIVNHYFIICDTTLSHCHGG